MPWSEGGEDGNGHSDIAIVFPYPEMIDRARGKLLFGPMGRELTSALAGGLEIVENELGMGPELRKALREKVIKAAFIPSVACAGGPPQLGNIQKCVVNREHQVTWSRAKWVMAWREAIWSWRPGDIWKLGGWHRVGEKAGGKAGGAVYGAANMDDVSVFLMNIGMELKSESANESRVSKG